MYIGNNPSALRSQQELSQAFLLLMRQYTFQEVTITMICQEARLSRQTFYQMFTSKEDTIRFLIRSPMSNLKTNCASTEN